MPKPVSVKIKKSDLPKKKYMAVFTYEKPLPVQKTIHFGAKGYIDFIQHKSEDRKNSYLARHAVRENWSVPDTAGSLSRWILWNKPTLKASIADFKRRFNLK